MVGVVEELVDPVAFAHRHRPHEVSGGGDGLVVDDELRHLRRRLGVGGERARGMDVDDLLVDYGPVGVATLLLLVMPIPPSRPSATQASHVDGLSSGQCFSNVGQVPPSREDGHAVKLH